MNGEALRRKVTIRNPHGLHVRPAAAFAMAADRFQARVLVLFEDRRVDGRRPLELMMLGAQAGDELTLEVDGPDAAAALEALAQVLGALEPPLPPKG